MQISEIKSKLNAFATIAPGDKVSYFRGHFVRRRWGYRLLHRIIHFLHKHLGWPQTSFKKLENALPFLNTQITQIALEKETTADVQWLAHNLAPIILGIEKIQGIYATKGQNRKVKVLDTLKSNLETLEKTLKRLGQVTPLQCALLLHKRHFSQIQPSQQAQTSWLQFHASGWADQLLGEGAPTAQKVRFTKTIQQSGKYRSRLERAQDLHRATTLFHGVGKTTIEVEDENNFTTREVVTCSVHQLKQAQKIAQEHLFLETDSQLEKTKLIQAILCGQELKSNSPFGILLEEFSTTTELCTKKESSIQRMLLIRASSEKSEKPFEEALTQFVIDFDRQQETYVFVGDKGSQGIEKSIKLFREHLLNLFQQPGKLQAFAEAILHSDLYQSLQKHLPYVLTYETLKDFMSKTAKVKAIVKEVDEVPLPDILKKSLYSEAVIRLFLLFKHLEFMIVSQQSVQINIQDRTLTNFSGIIKGTMGGESGTEPTLKLIEKDRHFKFGKEGLSFGALMTWELKTPVGKATTATLRAKTEAPSAYDPSLHFSASVLVSGDVEENVLNALSTK